MSTPPHAAVHCSATPGQHLRPSKHRLLILAVCLSQLLSPLAPQAMAAETASTPSTTQQAPATDAQLAPTFSAATADPASAAAAPEHVRKRRVTQGSNQAFNVRPYAPIQRSADEGMVPEIEMFVGESRVFPTSGVARVAVGNGGIMTAAPLDGKEVILFANGVGTSTLMIWHADGRYQRVKVNIVSGDTSRIAREIAAFLTAIPNAHASIIGDKVIVEGDNLSDADLNKIARLAERYSQIVNFTNSVGWEQMIMMDVKVVEFPTSVLRELGLRWGSTGGAAVGGIWSPFRRGSDGPYQIDVRTNNAAPITSANGGPLVLPTGLNVLSAVNLGLNAQLDLLAQEGKASVLAEAATQHPQRNGGKLSCRRRAALLGLQHQRHHDCVQAIRRQTRHRATRRSQWRHPRQG